MACKIECTDILEDLRKILIDPNLDDMLPYFVVDHINDCYIQLRSMQKYQLRRKVIRQKAKTTMGFTKMPSTKKNIISKKSQVIMRKDVYGQGLKEVVRKMEPKRIKSPDQL